MKLEHRKTLICLVALGLMAYWGVSFYDPGPTWLGAAVTMLGLGSVVRA